MYLQLSNGSVYSGKRFGADVNVSGEVVFSTSMIGYPESLTDPSYHKQLLCLTYPLIGNYGVPETERIDDDGLLKNIESSKPHIAGLLCAHYSEENSHYASVKSLSDWLSEHGIPGITCLDTRKLTLELQKTGSQTGRIVSCITDLQTDPIVTEPVLASNVSTKYKYTVNEDGLMDVCLVDCGTKVNIIRHLVRQGCRVTVVPHDYRFQDEGWDGVFLSNGPGDPRDCAETISNVKAHLEKPASCPLMGICLGHQIMALAAGMRIDKMKYGNRGYNQPVLCKSLNRTFITSQNHGYAVLDHSVHSPWEVWCVNKNDGSNEGIRHTTRPFCSVQFHPESRGGPHDTTFLFDDYARMCKSYRSDGERKKKIIVLGSGGLCIGQAGEFDYSGSQAIKKFKKLNYEVILVNPNIATNQTRKGFADKIYYLPVDKESVTRIIEQDKPDLICLSFGGQTALNCGIELHDSGVLHKHNVRVMGTSIDSIKKTEDRALFSSCMTAIGERTPKSCCATSVIGAVDGAAKIGYPVLVRAAFALGGLGSGFCNDEEELRTLVEGTFTKTSQVLIDEDLRGWKEVEYEVMRDKLGNSITVCNMENFDPLGVHTGDSIVVAPSQTLNNDEFNLLREASLKIANSLEIVGECNVQLTLDPFSSEYRVIEVNPRLSRSSALASKATGYPIASIAAELCLGQELHNVANPITGSTTANFEPSLDYTVVKFPKWDTAKFPGVNSRLGSAMQSVGEVMSIGRTFEEAFQKACRMATGKEFEPWGTTSNADIVDGLKHPTPDRVRLIAHAFRMGYSVNEIFTLSKIDKWYLQNLHNIHRGAAKMELMAASGLEPSDDMLRELKELGFSDRRIGETMSIEESTIANLRRQYGIFPARKSIDTVAGEFNANSNYHYLTYHATEDESCEVKSGKGTVIVLGSGKYRIGSSVEFDYATVGCVRCLMSEGYRTIVVNYNPETMSTDFDETDNLYFEELSAESVEEIYIKENAIAVAVSFGGQEPNNIAKELEERGVNLLGPTSEMIDLCEDREKYSSMLDELQIGQPKWSVATSLEQVKGFIDHVGYPVIVRPSYVLSGAAMQIVRTDDELASCLANAVNASKDKPVVITQLVEGAREVEIDSVFSNGEMIAHVVAEHVEDAGVHSGDATLVIPPYSISEKIEHRIVEIASRIGAKIGFSGICNTQLLVKGDWVGVIETNMRASRSAPFASKAVDLDLIEVATRSMLSRKPLEKVKINRCQTVGVKVAQFSFNRLPNADPILGIEMKSTGEVACFGVSLEEAFMKGMVSSRSGLKNEPNQKIYILNSDEKLSNLASIYGHSVTDSLQEADLMIDCSHDAEAHELRRLAIDRSIPFISDRKKAELAIRSMGVATRCWSYDAECLHEVSMVKLFVRQGFTESSEEQRHKLQGALDALTNYKARNGRKLDLLTGTEAQAKDTFKVSFENKQGVAFTPRNFRSHRIRLLNQADAMVIFRTGLSESTVFEVAYNIMRGNNVPIFFAIEPGSEIKTTLLRELDGYKDANVVYKTIEGGISNIATDPDFVEFVDKISTRK